MLRVLWEIHLQTVFIFKSFTLVKLMSQVWHWRGIRKLEVGNIFYIRQCKQYCNLARNVSVTKKARESCSELWGGGETFCGPRGYKCTRGHKYNCHGDMIVAEYSGTALVSFHTFTTAYSVVTKRMLLKSRKLLA